MCYNHLALWYQEVQGQMALYQPEQRLHRGQGRLGHTWEGDLLVGETVR